MGEILDAHRPDIVVLAGFMRMLSPEFVARYAGRMLNIHPSLLPEYRGLHTHRRVLEAGERYHGASVHFVTAELDGGPVVLQSRIIVRPGRYGSQHFRSCSDDRTHHLSPRHRLAGARDG